MYKFLRERRCLLKRQKQNTNFSLCRFKDTYEEDDESSSEASSSGSETGDASRKQEAQQAEKKKVAGGTTVRLEDLQEMGFRSGPSILTMKEQPPDISYEWWALVDAQPQNTAVMGVIMSGLEFISEADVFTAAYDQLISLQRIRSVCCESEVDIGGAIAEVNASLVGCLLAIYTVTA